ncbi:MAG TPA: hypothetical protein VGR57_08870, partial [Ktedonobacterales bacterium]|nr:hypothetical protein [Ktedonobacterales bacterium]
NIGVTATAAKGTRKQSGNVFGALTCAGSNCNSNGFYRGISNVAMHSGSINGGRAVIGIFGMPNIGNGSSGGPAVSIKTGALGATGVGLADITLGATNVQTQGLTVLATKGTEKAVGSSQSGLTAPTTFRHNFNINGGEARIKIRSGGSGSHSSGLLTVGGGPVTIGGNISVTGPTANVDVKGKTISVGGTVTVAGSGGTLTSTTVVTPPAGTGYSTSFNGDGRPTTLNFQGAVSGSVNVAGKIGVKAPGLVGVITLAGGVNLHGLSGSASAVKTYTVKDTRVSTTANTLAIGSLAVVVDGVKGVAGAPAFTSASDTGNVSLLSKGNVDLAARIKVGGTLAVQGAGNVFGNSNSVVTNFTALQNKVRAGSHSGGGAPKPGTLPRFSAQATAVSMRAGGNIDLTGAALNIGTGLAPGVTADSSLLAQLAAEKLSPAAPGPDGYFQAGNALTMGAITMTGDYLYLQGNAIAMTGPVSLPAKSVVQVSPFAASLPIDIEDTTLLAAQARTAAITFAATPPLFGLTNQAFLSLFPGDTIVIGNSAEVGSVTLGANGPIKLGSTNLIIDTLGPVTGLGTVTTTGVVKSLFTLLAIPPVTSGEIDPTSNTGLGDQTDKKKLGQPSSDTGTGQQGGTISSDTSGTGVCH